MRIIVTGGSSGVGKATAAALAGAGHDVLIACRTLPKAHRAAAEIGANVEVRHLDLADLESVRRFAASISDVDVLVNNAGVFGLPLTRTVDGFEVHMGTNHLGHFALTMLLGDCITDRVVVVGSALHRFARVHLDDLNWQARPYSKWAAYAQSKLAEMLFVHELVRRGVRAYITDPGAAHTAITRDCGGLTQWSAEYFADKRAPWLQTAEQGARASVEAVLTDLPSGTYLAPRFNQWGQPRVTALRAKVRNPDVARRLWEASSALTGCHWDGLLTKTEDTS
jgi:NAD(P)-dependent dehydrogenase (short-subunit alcohol dehydrogenase family)